MIEVLEDTVLLVRIPVFPGLSVPRACYRFNPFVCFWLCELMQEVSAVICAVCLVVSRPLILIDLPLVQGLCPLVHFFLKFFVVILPML